MPHTLLCAETAAERALFYPIRIAMRGVLAHSLLGEGQDTEKGYEAMDKLL